jgi:lia operon protein LiaG
VQCELVGPNRGITATTSGGDVRVTIPKDARGTLDAQSSGGDITTDFPVGTTRTAEHRLSGPINGGGEAIVARTSGGNIKLTAAQ